MSEPIKVGDLVVVVHWPCCGFNLGKVATVAAIDHLNNTRCSGCGSRPLGIPNADMVPNGIGSLACAPLAWLKRIPPLSELESERTQEDLREPA